MENSLRWVGVGKIVVETQRECFVEIGLPGDMGDGFGDHIERDSRKDNTKVEVVVQGQPVVEDRDMRLKCNCRQILVEMHLYKIVYKRDM